MNRSHERIHRDEKDLCSFATAELQGIYADLGLTKDELDLLTVPRRSFTVSFPVQMTSGKTQMLTGHRVQYKDARGRSEEHTSELQSRLHLVCRLLLEKKK